jgi:hypothetical protein
VYTSFKANPDMWMHDKIMLDGFQYWSYLLVYTDNILAINHEPQVVMHYLASRYTLRPGSVKEPEIYLGLQVSKF